MSSKLKVNNIIPSTGTQIGISTTGGGINLLTGTVVTGIITASGFDGPITQSGDFTIDDYVVHAGDTNTKFGFSANDTFSVETAGSQRLNINSVGDVTLGYAGNSLYFQNGFNNSTARIQNAGASNNSNLRFLTRSSGTESEKLRIDSNGNIGAGTGNTTIDEALCIERAGNVTVMAECNTSGSGSNAAFRLKSADSSTDWYMQAGNVTSGGLRFYNGNADSEKVRIDSSGRVLIGNFTDDIGDGTLQVYTADRKHPAIRTNSPNANGYTMLSDAYQSDESQVNIGVSYSSSSLVLSRGCKVSDAADNTYLSSQDSYNVRPTALVLDNDGALRFHTTETNATTTTDSAVSLTEVFKVDKVGNIYQRISNRYMWFGASNQLQIGVNGSDPYINAASGDLQVRDAGNVCYVVRSDNLQMYMDIKMNQGKGISFINAADTATGETVKGSVLDDYEYGTFTPAYGFDSAPTISYHTQKGGYVKVGPRVYFQIYIRLNSCSGGSGNLWITGLPYTAGNATSTDNFAYGGLTIAYTNQWSGNTVDRGLVGSSNTICYLYCGQSGGTNVNASPSNLNTTQLRASGSYLVSW